MGTRCRERHPRGRVVDRYEGNAIEESKLTGPVPPEDDSRIRRILGRIGGRRRSGPTDAEAPKPTEDDATISAEQEAGFEATSGPEAIVERGAEDTLRGSSPPAPNDPDGAEQEGGLPARVRNWLPMAIVAVSVLAAVMGWRASLAEESAIHSDELSRQDLIRQQDSVLQKIQSVDAEIRQFGLFEQYSLLGQALAKDAAGAGGVEAQLLTTQAQANNELARQLGGQFRLNGDYSPSNPANYYDSTNNTSGSLQPDGTYRPGNPYRVSNTLTGAQSGDSELTGLEPDLLRSNAKDQRQTGVYLIGLAALFIAGLVFFTLAAVSRGPRVLWLTACGLTVAVSAVILFPIVQFS